MTPSMCWAVPRQPGAWFSQNAWMATVTSFSFVKEHISAGESLRDHVLLEAFSLRSLPTSSPPSRRFLPDISNYFRVVSASRLLKRYWQTKSDALPTDSATTQSQPEVGFSLANDIAAAIASGSNRARKGCLLTEGGSTFQRDPLCVTQEQNALLMFWSHDFIILLVQSYLLFLHRSPQTL